MSPLWHPEGSPAFDRQPSGPLVRSALPSACFGDGLGSSLAEQSCLQRAARKFLSAQPSSVNTIRPFEDQAQSRESGFTPGSSSSAWDLPGGREPPIRSAARRPPEAHSWLLRASAAFSLCVAVVVSAHGCD